MATIGDLPAEEVAEYIDLTTKVLEAAEECDSDRWVVVQLSGRKSALVTDVSLVPSWETVIAKKELNEEPEFFVPKPRKREYTLRKDAKVGIYDNCEYVARLYKDRIVLTIPYVKWEGSTGGYAERKERITDLKTVREATQAAAYRQDERAWSIIGNYIQDAYLAQSND